MTELLPLNSRTGRFVQIPDFSCSAACKDTVMLHKDHCRLAGKNQLLYLNPRKNVDILSGSSQIYRWDGSQRLFAKRIFLRCPSLYSSSRLSN